ncbi:MAG: TolC family protein [Gemmatimonadota bacterium]|nr:TolC family protein [Gemmatimonadota bacterium]
MFKPRFPDGRFLRPAILAIGLAATVLLARPAPAQIADPDPSAVPEMTVEEAVSLAIEANESVRIARAGVDRTEGRVREAFSRALPDVTGNYRMTRNLQRPVLFFDQEGETVQISIGDQQEHAFSLSVEQPIYDRSLGAAVTAARHGRAASEASYRRTLSDVAFRARSAYYDALLAEALVGARENALRLAEERLRQVERFHEVGTASDFDLLTAQVGVENERPPLIRARNRMALARNQLKRVVGVAIAAPVRLADSLAYAPVPVDLEAALERAFRERDDLKAQREAVALQRELVAVERAEGFPTLSLMLDLTRRASSADFVPEDRDFSQSASAALMLRIPIFDGRRAEGRELQARADRVAATERLHALERDIRVQVQDAWQSVRAAAEEVEATRATAERAREAYRIALVRFRQGLSTQLELDEAEQDVFEAESNAARALYSHMLAAARLENTMGAR